MEKATKRILAAGIICSIVGACFCGLGYAAGGWDYVRAADLNKLDGAAKLSDTEEMKEDRILLDEVFSVDAEIRDFNFKIRRSEDENYYLSYCLQEEKGELPLTYEMEQGTLKLRKKNYFYFLQISIPWFSKERKEEEVVLYIPEHAVLEQCRVSAADNNLMFENLDCEKVEIKQHYGGLEINDCEFRQGTISSSDGGVEAEKFCFRDVDFDLHDSSMELKEGILDEVGLKLSDGDLESQDLELKNEILLNGHYADLNLNLKKGQEESLSLVLDSHDGSIEVAPEYYGASSAAENGDKEHFEYNAREAAGTLKANIWDGGITIR